MGCCFSNEEEKDPYANAEPDENTRLLSDPVSNSVPRTVVGDNYSSSQTHQNQQRGDEQSALAKILHKTARNVIDVATIDAQTVEQHEYHDRARQYSNRLTMVFSGPGRSKNYRPSLPNGVSAPQIVLSSQPISLSDIQMITTAAEKASKAYKEVKVHHKEDLVVPFGVP